MNEQMNIDNMKTHIMNLVDEVERVIPDSIVVFWPRSSVPHLARTGCCLANK